MLCNISLTVVQQSTRIDALYFSADLEIAVWATQFCVIIHHSAAQQLRRAQFRQGFFERRVNELDL